MHPKFADRLARRTHVIKRTKGVSAASHFITRMLAGYGVDDPARAMVHDRAVYWNQRAATGLKVTDND